MKNLLERLKPELRERLEVEKGKYPSSVKEIERELEENNNFFELSYNTAYMMSIYLKTDLNLFSLNFETHE